MVNKKSEGAVIQRHRTLSEKTKTLVWITGLIWVLFHIYTALFGTLYIYQQRVIFLTFSLVLCFIVYTHNAISINRDKILVYDILLIICSVALGIYVFTESMDFTFRSGMPTRLDIVCAVLYFLLLLEANRRVTGKAIPIIAIVIVAYAMTGQYWPSLFTHPGYDLNRIANHMLLSTEGIFGLPLAIGATYLTLFFIMGYLLQSLGGGVFFIDLAHSFFGRFRGGPAKIAVIASALFGSITGQAAVNVATTGMITIPLMKKLGYKPEYAGAVEAAASSGGQFMPPVMGAAAFIMAEVLGVPYSTVARAALVPAVLYFVALLLMTDLQGIKLGMKGLPKSELPSRREVLKKGWLFSIPILLLIYMLMIAKYTPMKSAVWACLAVFFVSLMKKENLQRIKELPRIVGYACLDLIPLGLICACIGIVIGVFSLTGLSLRFSSILIQISGGNVLFLLILTMLASLLVGMGLPTLAAYIMLSILVVPALIDLGVMPLAAHLFVLYYGAMSSITPPVCFAAIVGAQIAGADTVRTAFTAIKIAVAAFLLPFMFVYSPSLLIEGNAVQIILAIVSALAGVWALAAAVEGFLFHELKWISRIVLFASSLFLIKGGWETDLIGLIAFGSIILVEFYMMRKGRRSAVDV